MATLLNSSILNSAILDSAILHKTLTQTSSIWLKLIYSDSTWWWQPSVNSAMLDSDKKAVILDSDTLFSSLRFTQKHSHSFRLWLTLIQSDSNSFILTKLNDGSHLEYCHFEFGHLWFIHVSLSSQTDSHLPRLVPTICTKKLHSFILTQLDDGSHLEFCQVGFRHCHLEFRHLVIFSQIHSKALSLHSDSDSNWFNLTQSHSFWLNLMMVAILDSAKLDSDTAILNSDTLLSSLRFTQKHYHSTMTDSN